MTSEQAKSYITTLEPDFLPRAHNIGNKHSFVCPCCSNGRGSTGTGITMKPNSYNHPRYHCFKCGADGDIFDLAKIHFGITDMCTLFNTVYDYFNIVVDEIPSSIPQTLRQNSFHYQIEELPQQIQKIDQTAYFQTCMRNLDASYLESRGLSLATQQHFLVGTDNNWVHPNVIAKYESKGKPVPDVIKSPRCIIPTSRYSYLARDTRKDLSDKQADFAKSKYGNVTLFNEKFTSRQNIVFVVEGEIDAMSVYEATVGQYEASGLGSVSNWRKFVAEYEEGKPFYGKPTVLLLDNDKAGEQCANFIKEALESKGILVMVPEYNGKDPNNALVDNRNEFMKTICDTANQIEEILERTCDPVTKEPNQLDIGDAPEI